MARYDQHLISASLGGVNEFTTVAVFTLQLESDKQGELHLERTHLTDLWRSRPGQRFRETADWISDAHRRLETVPHRPSLGTLVVLDITGSSVVRDELADGISPVCVRVANNGERRKDEYGRWRVPRDYLMERLAVEVEEPRDDKRVLAAALDGDELDLYRRAFTNFRENQRRQRAADPDADASRVNALDDAVWAVGVGFWWATEMHRPSLFNGPASVLSEYDETRYAGPVETGW